MTLFGTILKKVMSHDSMKNKYSSPPPEAEVILLPKKKKKYVDKFAHVVSRVDSSPPALQAHRMFTEIPRRRALLRVQCCENIEMLTAIRRQFLLGGRVDSHWERPLAPCTQYFHTRKLFLRQVCKDNQRMYKLIKNAKARVTTTESMRRDWEKNRQMMISGADKKFVLFEPEPQEQIEDISFTPPSDYKRPRVHIELGVVGAASLGTIEVELFMDFCPLTCGLFLDLLDGDGLGHGYVGTCFFTKVPGLYVSGGDVIYDNGCGCYAQRGRRAPISAENYHFSHSMPGLLSMRMTPDDEMCGIFNITFKALPQFDLKNVVFGRVIRPCSTYDTLRSLGAPLSPRPIVVIRSSTRVRDGRIVRGLPNTKLARITHKM